MHELDDHRRGTSERRGMYVRARGEDPTRHALRQKILG